MKTAKRRKMMRTPEGRAFLIENGFARRPSRSRMERDGVCPACWCPKALCACVAVDDRQESSRG
jgi:hypothetical protein